MSAESWDINRLSVQERQFRLLLSAGFRAACLEQYRRSGKEAVPQFASNTRLLAAVARVRVHDALEAFGRRVFPATIDHLCRLDAVGIADIERDYIAFCQQQSPEWIDVDASSFCRYALGKFSGRLIQGSRITALEYAVGYIRGRCDGGAIGISDCGFEEEVRSSDAFLVRLNRLERLVVLGKDEHAEDVIGMVIARSPIEKSISWATIPAQWIPEHEGVHVYACPNNILELVGEACSSVTGVQ